MMNRDALTLGVKSSGHFKIRPAASSSTISVNDTVTILCSTQHSPARWADRSVLLPYMLHAVQIGAYCYRKCYMLCSARRPGAHAGVLGLTSSLVTQSHYGSGHRRESRGGCCQGEAMAQLQRRDDGGGLRIPAAAAELSATRTA